MVNRRTTSRRNVLRSAGALAAASAASACGVLPDGTKRAFVPDVSAAGEIRLSVWGDVSDAAIYEEVLDTWHRRQNKYRARAEQYTGNYYDKVLANFAGSIPADVIYFQGWHFQPYAESNVLQPLDEFIERDGLQARWPKLPTFRDYTQWRGRTYMAPVDGGSIVMLYNKDIFDERGVPYPSPDWTWDDFVEMVPKLTFKKGATKYYGFAQAGGWLGGYGRAVGFMRRNGHVEWDRIVEPTEQRWQHEDVVSALQFTLVDCLRNRWAPGPSAVAGGGISFATGKVALTPEGPWYLPNLHGPLATTKAGINYDVVGLPLGERNPVRNSWSLVHGHVMSAQSKNKEAAWDLIKFITSDEGQEIVARGGRMCATPANIKNIWAPIAGKAFNFSHTDAFADSQAGGVVPMIMGQGSPISADGGEPLDSVWTALELADRTAEQILAEYGPGVQAVLDDYWASRARSN